VKHARYYWLLLAESGLTRRLFGADGTPHCHPTGIQVKSDSGGRRD